MKLSIHHHLVGLVFVAVIPIMLFASGLVFHLADQRSKTLETNILTSTKALVTAVDENIESVATSLRILALSEGFEADTIQFLHKRLRGFVDQEKSWNHISFVDTNGVQIFNTSKPYGRKLPRLNKDPLFQKMMASGKMVISGYRPDENVITVSVPVKKHGMIIYALIGSLNLNTFSRILDLQKLPTSWTASILDGEMNYISHSRNASYFTGKKASEVFINKSQGDGAYAFSYQDDQGNEIFGALANSRVTDWKIMLRIPDDGHLFTSWKTISWIVVGGSLLLALSVLCAMYLGWKISTPLLALRQSARALGKGGAVSEIKTNLSEVSEVSTALKAAAEERSRNEQRIHELYGQAQEAVKIRDTFMSVASHELKTPITTIKLQFQLLKRMMVKNPTLGREDLEKPILRVDNVVNRLNVLIDDLLDVSRISAGKLTYHPEPIQLGPFISEIIQDLQEEASRNGTVIHFHQDEEILGNWDRHRLEQVIVNLLTNSIKYGNSRPVFVNLKLQDRDAVVEVIDNGLGISPENLSKIFDRFERVGNHNGIHGLGLGLWIVKKVLEGFDASISVESVVGKGSVFRVSLPKATLITRSPILPKKSVLSVN